MEAKGSLNQRYNGSRVFTLGLKGKEHETFHLPVFVGKIEIIRQCVSGIARVANGIIPKDILDIVARLR